VPDPPGQASYYTATPCRADGTSETSRGRTWQNEGSAVPGGLRYSHGMPDSVAPLVAVVEDEDTIREAVGIALRREGHRVEVHADGAAAWRAFDAALPDLAILDIGLPLVDGLELCRRLRARSDVLPIIFVTSREEEFDRVLGLEIGADDYLCKPFSMRELMARIKVLLRRAALSTAAVTPEADTITLGPLRLDGLRLAAHWHDRAVLLTVTEFLLLQALARRPGVVRTRDQLMDAAYPDRISVSDRTIDSHVKRIRRKFALVDPTFDAIEAVYGAGYRYRA
jgi:two-component system response regulator ChvI